MTRRPSSPTCCGEFFDRARLGIAVVIVAGGTGLAHHRRKGLVRVLNARRVTIVGGGEYRS